MTKDEALKLAQDAGFWREHTNTWMCSSEDIERFADLVRADERNAIYDQWHSCVMADLENGVKWLNEKAAAEWHKNYPAQSNLFPSWVEARGQS